MQDPNRTLLILIDRYKDKGFSLLKRMLKNEFDAEEVLQDCFLKTFHSLRAIIFMILTNSLKIKYTNSAESGIIQKVNS